MINLDKEGKYYYNQLKGIISPKESCNVNSMCAAFEILKQDDKCWNINYKKDLTRIPDKLIYFLRNEPLVRELYKKIDLTCYDKWINDKTKNKDLYSDNSIPPNEYLKVLTIGFNLFMNMAGDSYTNYCEMVSLSEDEMKKELEKKHPMVCSFTLNNYGHIMTVIGYNEKGFLVYDSYGMPFLKEHEKIGKATVIPFPQFKEICKIKNSKKLCILFKT